MKQILIAFCLVLAAQLALAKDSPGALKTAATKAAQEPGLSGKVVETMNAASYTYVQVDTGKEKVWAAAPQFQVKVGDQVATSDAMPMRNYHSKTLNRDFDVVYFAGGFTVNGAQANAGAATPQLPAGHPPVGGNSATPQLPEGHPPLNAAVPGGPNLDLKGIKKASGGKTVEEVYASKASLKGKTTSVRGKVVKYNSNIMGKNWVHLRDGTGKDGSNDLLVTTSQNVKVGDVVVATGKVAVDKDFGANYKYGVMMEDGKIVVE